MATLCQLADVKSYLNISDTNSDVLLGTYIVPGISQAILTYLNRPIFSASFTDTFDGNGGTLYSPRNYPLTAVTSLLLQTYSVQPISIPAAGSLGGPGYSFSDIAVYLIGYAFPRGRQNCQLQYTAGYSTTPSDLSLAAIMCCAHQLRRSKQLNLKSENVGQQQTTFAAVDFPPEALTIINLYRKVSSS